MKREATSTALVAEAIHTGKLLLKWNPGDSQGVRMLLCNWMLEAGDKEGCSQLLRSFGGFRECSLAYTDVLLRFQSWTRGDVAEEDARTALSVALRSNMLVPGLLLEDQVARVKFESLDSGGPREAASYVQDAHSIWRRFPAALEWLSTQKVLGGIIPGESELVALLRTEVVRIHCRIAPLGDGPSKEKMALATRAREKCFGNGRPSGFPLAAGVGLATWASRTSRASEFSQ